MNQYQNKIHNKKIHERCLDKELITPRVLMTMNNQINTESKIDPRNIYIYIGVRRRKKKAVFSLIGSPAKNSKNSKNGTFWNAILCNFGR